MREHKRVTQMSNKELMTYRRALRRKMVMRRRILVAAMTLCIISILAFTVHSFTSDAKDENKEVKYKYYTSIEVMPGENLWDIAKDYIDYSEYKSTAKYIDEVASINNLKDTGDIKAGQKLIIPYYSTAFIK